MSFNLENIFFLENYKTLLIIDNSIYISNKKYFSVESFKNERYLDKNLIEIHIEDILKLSYNNLSDRMCVEITSKKYLLIFFSNKTMLQFIERLEPSLRIFRTERKLNTIQRILPSTIVFLVIALICYMSGVTNNIIIFLGLLCAIFQIYRMFGNSRNIEYKSKKK
jgi:hypothetical protein